MESNHCIKFDVEQTLRLICIFTLLPPLAVTLANPLTTELTTQHAICVATRNSIIVQAVYYVLYTTIMVINTLAMRPDPHVNKGTDSQQIRWVQTIAGNMSSCAMTIHLILHIHDRVNLVTASSCLLADGAPIVVHEYIILALIRQLTLAWWFGSNLWHNNSLRQREANTTDVSAKLIRSSKNLKRQKLVSILRDAWWIATFVYTTVTVALTLYASSKTDTASGPQWRIVVDAVNVLALALIQAYKNRYSNEAKSMVLTSNKDVLFRLY